MSDNTFFLREGYTIEEKESRILAEDFSVDNPLVVETLDNTRITIDEYRDMGKSAKLNNFHEQLSQEAYADFIDEMFRRHGQKGDRFNQQLFVVPPLADLSGLDEKLEYFENQSLTPTFDDILTQRVFLNTVVPEENHTTLKFNTASRTEEYESDNEVPIRILDEDGEVIDEVPENQMVSIPNRTRVEVRIYKSAGYISISNSEVPSRLQSEIFNVINRIITSDLEEMIYD